MAMAELQQELQDQAPRRNAQGGPRQGLYRHADRGRLRRSRADEGKFLSPLQEQGRSRIGGRGALANLHRRFFATAPYHAPSDPLDRIIAYVEFRKSMLTGDLPEYTCFAGTIIQEAYRTHPEVSAACEMSISRHADTLEADIRAAMRKCGVRGQWTARSLALHIQAVIQGGFILAKAEGSARVAEQNLEHLRRYIELLFGRSTERPARRKGGAS